jgi:catechol 2,3-dioxygenase-like lactoylglutathione lyase family enzyme
MKFVRQLLVLTIVLAGIAQGQNPGGADALGGFRPYLIGISVPNAQQAAAWYEEKLGFKRGGSEKTDTGTILIVEESLGFAVELLQFDGSFSIHRSNPDYDTASGKLQGIVKIGFAVDNLEAALADLKRKQVRVIREITELKSFNVKFFLIEDNNGNVIQVFQARKNQPQTEGVVNR